MSRVCPARVFAELSTDLEMARHRDPRSPVVHLFMHAALYIPREMVQAVRQYAHLAAVFILPSGGKLDLDYLDLLNAHWVVDHATLASGAARADAAKSILTETQGASEAAKTTDGVPVSIRPPPGGPRSLRGTSQRPPPPSAREE
jgi:hypothetical protein